MQIDVVVLYWLTCDCRTGALGADPIRTHMLLCASQQRMHAQTTAEILELGECRNTRPQSVG